MSKPRILLARRVTEAVAERARREFDAALAEQDLGAEAAIRAAAEHRAEALVISAKLRLDAGRVAAVPDHVRMVATVSVGFDHIDVEAAHARGLVVTNTPDVLTEEVADTTLGLLLSTVREFYQAEKWLRDGRWAPEGDYRLTPASLRDRSVGIAGLGRIGKAIGRRLEAFGLPVSYFGRRQQADVAYKFYNDLVAMARDVDTLIVVTPGGPGTQNLINAAVLNALGPRGILINMSRGSVVDEAALIDALRKRTILAAGLDVFVGEPQVNPALLELDNLTMFPHVGSASVHTRNAMGQLVVDNLVAFTQGKPPKTPVPETPFKGW
jgi:lactate dehydrogenase-like 2-hydroxyacid dehydrogenase